MNKTLIIIILLFSVISCDIKEKPQTEKSINSELYSSDFKTDQERVKVLKKHIKYYSEFEDAHFKIINANGNLKNERTIIPGASFWDYKYVVKTNPKNVDKWILGFERVEKSDNAEIYNWSWIDSLNSNFDYKNTTNFEYFYGDSIKPYYFYLACIDRTNGLVFRRIKSN